MMKSRSFSLQNSPNQYIVQGYGNLFNISLPQASKLIMWAAAFVLLLSANNLFAQSNVLFVDTIKNHSTNPALRDDLNLEEDSLYDAIEAEIDSLDEYINGEYVPKVSMELLKDRLGCIENQVPLVLNKKVAGFIDFFVVRKRNYTQTMLERKDFYFPVFEYYLKKYELPEEIKYLAIVESGLNYSALSRAGALGLWQFMPFTGKDYKLHQDFYIDERMDPHKATEAACKYLKRMYKIFGDWELALASYNCGPGNVMAAMRRSGHRRFWDIYEYLPKETRAYVPQFTALAYAMNYAEYHNIYPDADSMLTHVPLDSVLVERCISIDLLAKHLGVDQYHLRVYNPSLRRAATPDERPYWLKVPAEVKPFFLENIAALYDSVVISPRTLLAKGGRKHKEVYTANSEKGITWYQVERGEGLLTVAKKFDVKPEELIEWNKLNTEQGLQVGQRLMIKSKHGVERLMASTEKPAKQKKNKRESRKFHTVEPGDTLWAISKKYNGVTVAEIVKLNRLRGKKIEVGQKLIVG